MSAWLLDSKLSTCFHLDLVPYIFHVGSSPYHFNCFYRGLLYHGSCYNTGGYTIIKYSST